MWARAEASTSYPSAESVDQRALGDRPLSINMRYSVPGAKPAFEDMPPNLGPARTTSPSPRGKDDGLGPFLKRSDEPDRSRTVRQASHRLGIAPLNCTKGNSAIDTM